MPRRTTANRRARRRSRAPRQGVAAFLPEAVTSPAGAANSALVRTVKFLVGLLLLPLCWVLLETFVVLLKADTLAERYWQSDEFVALGIGALAWTILFFGFRCRPMMWLYVAGHELTHALFVLLCRGRITRIHISSDGGHVLTNRNNFLIALSPYFFPFYTAAGIGAWAAANWIVRDPAPLDPAWLYGTIGFTWMFHLTFTLWMIRREQPDLDQNGRLFSFSVIFLVNVLLICALLITVSPTATFHAFGRSLWQNATSFPQRFIESAGEIYGSLPI